MDATRATTAEAGGGGGAPRQYKRDPKGSHTGGQFTRNPSSTSTTHKPAKAAPTPRPLVPIRAHGRGSMRRGGHNDPAQVRQLQALLGVLGLGKPPTSGEFDDATEAAVKNAQQRLGLKPTGRATTALVNKLIDSYSLSPCVQRSAGSDEFDLLRSACAAGDFDDDEPMGGAVEVIDRAAMSAAAINDLPDSEFAYIEPGGSKDEQGKTVPRELRHFPIHDAAHVRNALARMDSSPFGGHARKKILAAAKKMNIGDYGTERSETPEPAAEILRYDRTFALDDILVRSGGDGRTVEAYAAVFDSPSEIKDQHGHYMEVISRSAFNRAISHGIDRVNVFYHHGMTLHGTPSDLGSVPIGSPVDIRPDGRGLRTVTRFNRSQLADSVLEAIRDGNIRGYSFRGRVFQSNPARVPRSRPGTALPTITRTELGLAEYGPTPTPAYADAGIVAVRSLDQVASTLAALDADERAELIRMLTVSTPIDPEAGTATPDVGPGTEDSPEGRSGRLQQFQAELRKRGVLK